MSPDELGRFKAVVVMAHRYRMYPTTEEAAGMVRHCADARFVWNLALEQANDYRRERGPTPDHAERMRQLAEARGDNPWLAEGSSSVQQGALRDFDQAMRNWWAGTHRRPVWRRKGRNEGFVVRDLYVRPVSRKWATVHVPKVSRVRFRLSRPLPDGTRSARVTLDHAGRWHIAFVAAQPVIERADTGRTVGIDRGVAVSAALSDGRTLSCPQPRAKRAERLVRLQRKSARQWVRGRPSSNRLRRTYRQIARLRVREVDARRDWAEKLSTALVREHDVVVFEKLHTAHMSRSARGTAERPGINVRQKAGLNRSILAAGWAMLARRTRDKAHASDVAYIEVSSAFTSQTCPVCGLVDQRNRESQAFRCVGCGHTDHADVNAAKVILARGLAGTAPGLGVAGRGDPAARWVGEASTNSGGCVMNVAGGIPPMNGQEEVNAPVPSTGTQDLAERVAAARQQIAHEGTGYVPAWEGLTPHEQKMAVLEAANWMKAIRVAGLAVVELPEVVLRERRVNGIGLEIEVPTPGVRSREVTGQHVPGYDEDSVGLGEIGWRSLDDARRDAARILAACDAVERLRAEHGGESR